MKECKTENHFQIRKTEERDLPRVMELYEGARKFMAETGNPKQWGATNWPPEEVIREDIREGNSYVCVLIKDNSAESVVGCFCFRYGYRADPCYDEITDGAWPAIDELGEEAGDTYGVVHRLAADTAVKGVGSFCLNYAYEKSRHMRVDTHGDNTVMQNLLKKLGFQPCGIIHVIEDNDPRIAYEKYEHHLGKD